MKKLLSKVQRKILAIGFMLVLAALAGCSLLSLQNGTSASLFAVDSKNGNVYEIDTEKAQGASIPLVSIKQNATGEMIVNGTKAFIAVGSYNNKPRPLLVRSFEQLPIGTENRKQHKRAIPLHRLEQ